MKFKFSLPNCRINYEKCCTYTFTNGFYRLPGKPLMAIDGIPMIQRVWQRAIESNIGEVFVACSEIEVHDLIVSNGGKAIMTDPNLLWN